MDQCAWPSSRDSLPPKILDDLNKFEEDQKTKTEEGLYVWDMEGNLITPWEIKKVLNTGNSSAPWKEE